MKIESLTDVSNLNQDEQQTIRFCDDCNNILIPFNDENVLGYKCLKPSCGFKIKIDARSKYENLVSRKEFLKEKKLIIDADFAKDPTMPRESVECPSCSYNDAAFFISTDIEDTKIELIYICGNVHCSFSWKKPITE